MRALIVRIVVVKKPDQECPEAHRCHTIDLALPYGRLGCGWEIAAPRGKEERFCLHFHRRSLTGTHVNFENKVKTSCEENTAGRTDIPPYRRSPERACLAYFTSHARRATTNHHSTGVERCRQHSQTGEVNQPGRGKSLGPPPRAAEGP